MIDAKMHSMETSCMKATLRKGLTIAIQSAILGSVAFRLGSEGANAAYQEPCTEIRINLQGVYAKAKLIEQKSPRLSEAEIQKIKELLQTATENPQCLLESLSDNEAFALVKALCRLESYFREGSNSEQMFLWETFVKRYPHSSHLDEARWLRAKIAATPYEYEGYADAALQQIKSIEVFIKENLTNRYLADAELELARACRIAYETFRYGDGLSTNSKVDRQEAGHKYRDRARQLLQHLCNESSDLTRAEACRALRDLTKGQCVYMGPGSPNPNLPDHWAALSHAR